MLEVYCDESVSSIGGEDFLVFAGYVAPERNWNQFRHDWRRHILEKYSVPYLHAKDLRSGNAPLYRHLDLSSRRNLVEDACRLIGAHATDCVAVYMRLCDFDLAVTSEQRSRWGSAYGACAVIMLSVLSEFVRAGERVSIFVEDGHVNARDAITRIKHFKFDTEPVRWPSLVGEATVGTYEDPMRTQTFRIGKAGLVSKDSEPTQAADLLAYLVATFVQTSPSPVFEGVLDDLFSRVPCRLSPWGPGKVVLLGEVMADVEQTWRDQRRGAWEVKKALREKGCKVYELPWGLVIDEQPGDSQSDELRRQVNEILDNLKQDQ